MSAGPSSPATATTNPSRGPALRRLAFRLAVIVIFAAVWPSLSVAAATAALCAMLAVGCAAAAYVRGEPLRATTLNRWHEAAILVVIAGLVLLTR
jgi:hypothetical protein